MQSKKQISQEESIEILQILKNRFESNMNRHPKMDWKNVETKLKSNPEKIWSLLQMENTGGEPDVISIDEHSATISFYDCSEETPKGRRNTCYDLEGLESRKEHRPANNAMDMANSMGVQILNEEQYKKLQSLGKFDLKTSSWILTTLDIRKLGGALFGDRRYNHVFVYHNGAQSYYAVRGFRACLEV